MIPRVLVNKGHGIKMLPWILLFILGKLAPKQRPRTGPVGMLSSLIGTSVAETAPPTSSTSSLSSAASTDDGPVGDDELNETLDYVFRIVFIPRPDTSIGIFFNVGLSYLIACSPWQPNAFNTPPPIRGDHMVDGSNLARGTSRPTKS